MVKKMMVGLALSALFAAGVQAAGFDLKTNMQNLNKYMVQMQTAFIVGDKAEALKAVTALGEESKHLLADEAVMAKMLPKAQAHKVRIATTSARMIEENVETIKANMENVRRDAAQNAYLDIQRACMRCHNLVRDW